MTFKVGDKVEVIGNKSAHCHKIGSVCVVTAVGLVDWQLDGKAAGWVTDSEIKLAEIGTLKELDVKPGDVVEYIRGFDGMYPDYIGKRMIGDDHGGVKFGGNNGFSAYVNHTFRVISRATQTPKLWRDMTDAEKGALLLAYHNDKKCIEVWQFNRWDKCGNSTWKDNIACRIRPEPKVETVTLYNGIDNSFDWDLWNKHINKKHRITFNTIDGKPDTASIKMEAI